MPSRKKEEVKEPFDYERERARLVESMCSFHISRIDEMPRIELYLDQVISIVSTELAPLYASDEKIITGSMVNNYVKQRVMPAPNRKRYTRRHLAHLLFICCLKRVLPIAQVAQLIDLCRQSGLDISHAHDVLTEALEDALVHRFGGATREEEPSSSLELLDQNGKPVTGELPILLERAIGLVADKTYVDKVLDLEERRAKAELSELIAQVPES